tara:strand:- start:796 stop:1920 length:1125 start_codon:yes stop_codon:yes gene_type:complete
MYSESFNQNKYLYLPNFLDKDNCQELVKEFKKLIDQGESKKDPQCPLSDSLGHTALFDSLLEQLTPQMEQATGKKLFPTYAYARWYAPGDELKIHRDRPSCEVSATITLGFQGEQWPIYMGYDQEKKDCRQINMNVGDAVVYKGEELYHWREKYKEGQWQAQVFIHYVDQDGPNAEWKYDKRDSLAHHNSNSRGSGLYRENLEAFSEESCQRIIEQFENNMNLAEKAALGDGHVNTNIRDAYRISIPNHKGIGSTLTGMGFQCNYQFWKFNVTHANQSEFLRYDKNGHFESHVDTFLEAYDDNVNCRKLTLLLFLNNDFEGGKFFISTGTEKIYPRQRAGDVVCFPSFLVHGVEPVTSGIRRTIVNWLVGPYFK